MRLCRGCSRGPSMNCFCHSEECQDCIQQFRAALHDLDRRQATQRAILETTCGEKLWFGILFAPNETIYQEITIITKGNDHG